MSERPAANTNAPALVDDRADDLVDDLVHGRRRFHALPAHLSARERAEARREALARLTGADLEHLGRYSLDDEVASSRNCECFLGAAQVPVGVVGPLLLHGDHVDGPVYVPLATTEGALIASTNRGCSAIRAAGGAQVLAEDVGMTRAPVFRTSGVRQTREFLAWVEDNTARLGEAAEATSSYLKLMEIRPHTFGTSVFLRFRFQTGDAMGMNMVTIACDRLVRDIIEPETGVPCVALSGNYCVDKKPAEINFHEGRGKRIHAEVVLEAPVLQRTLKTTARALVEAQYRKNLLGSIASGSMGYNAQMANALAAFFIATGQDPAHVAEAAVGVTLIEPRGPEAVVASVDLPDVPLGAVGGGTQLATQQEALRLLGVQVDPERPGAAALRLAEILGGVVLAAELSLMAAFTSRDLARAHERLGRGRGD
jgi:hydroxymethylglutaryl-CoA reductase (NADPH)